MFLTRLGFGSQDGRHRRHHADRPAARAAVGAHRRRATSCEDVEGIDFVRFGGEDVVRHRLVQRIVEAYDAHAERRRPELRPAERRRPSGRRRRRPAPCSRSRSSATRRRARRPRRGRAPRRARAGLGRASTTATSRSSSSTPRGSPSSTREHRGKDGPTDVLSFPVDGDGARGRRPARARRRRDLPAAHGRPARGDRPRGAAPVGHGPRDRRRRDARAAGASCCRGDRGADARGLRRARRPPERRQVDARQRARRPQGRDRLRQAADDAAGDPRRRHRAATRSSCSSTCPASSARATR